MPTRVHQARDLRTVRKILTVLLNWKSIDIAAQGNRPFRTRREAFNVDIDAGMVKCLCSIQTKSRQRFDDPLLRFRLLVRQLGFAMHRMTHFDYSFAFFAGEQIVGKHCRDLQVLKLNLSVSQAWQPKIRSEFISETVFPDEVQNMPCGRMHAGQHWTSKRPCHLH